MIVSCKKLYWFLITYSPEQKYKNLEQKIFDTLEESILASSGPKPDFTLGLNKAKEASSLDRQLLRIRDQNGGSHSHNFDLTYSVSSVESSSFRGQSQNN